MTQILHITHVKNLPSIFAGGGLWSPNHRPASLAPAVVNSYANIQARRARRSVPCARGGVLHDYIPFYFGARSPMLYANHKGSVPGNPDGQRAIVYLTSDAETVASANLSWAFTDGHADVAFTTFYDDLAQLPSLDWSAIDAVYWADTPDEPDRKRRKQAEFLVHEFVPLQVLTGLVVIDAAMQGRVNQEIQAAGVHFTVAIDRSWYY